MVAADRELDNLSIIYDHNKSQTRCLQIPNPGERFAAFGCRVDEVPGHNLPALTEALGASAPDKRPQVVVADTIKGYGCKTLVDNVFEFGYTQLYLADIEPCIIWDPVCWLPSARPDVEGSTSLEEVVEVSRGEVTRFQLNLQREQQRIQHFVPFEHSTCEVAESEVGALLDDIGASVFDVLSSL